MNVFYLCIACLEGVYVHSYWTISFILKGILLKASKFNVRMYRLLLQPAVGISCADYLGT